MDRKRLIDAYNRVAAARNQERRMSAANEYQQGGLEGTRLAKIEPLKNTFDQAQEPRDDSLEQKQNTPTEQQPVSAAKQYQPNGLAGTSLDQEDRLRAAFDRVRDGQPDHIQTSGKAPEPSRSEMIARNMPRLNMNPPSPIRSGPDRQKYNTELSQEHQREREKKQELLDRMKALKARQRRQERGRMRDGREMD